jgi:hypothetical protein
MRRTVFASAVAILASVGPVSAAPSIAEILAANKAAIGGAAWDAKESLFLNYDYAGQGLTGTSSSVQDLKHGAFVDSYTIGPQHGDFGFDGAKAWEREPSGTVTDQAGGDVVPLAITEAYQDQNLWWRPDYGGAHIDSMGRKTVDGRTFDVLDVRPQGGTPLEAWFDVETHLLARTVEMQGTLKIATTYSDYAPHEDIQVPRKVVVDDGSGAANLQTLTLVQARFMVAQSPYVFTKPAQLIKDYGIAGGAAETTVPFQLINNHIYADVSVNGSKPMPFIFDTGGHDILTPETAKALNIGAEGHLTSTGGGEGTAQTGLAKADTITVGGATLRNQPVSTLQFGPPGVEGIHEAGMIGYEFFARFITRFDYGRRTITFIDRNRFDPKDAGTAVPMRLYHQFPEVLGSYDGIPGRFGIDTGSRMALMLTGPFAAAHDIRAGVKRGAEALTGWGVGGPSRSFVFRGGALKLGQVTVDNPLTQISTDKGGAGASEAFPNNIGGGVLKRFVVTLDYANSIIYLKPIEGPVADLDTFDRSGLWINEAADGFEIVDVATDGPGGQAGLAKGDVITAVDGKPAGSIHLYELRQRLRNDPPGTNVALSVKRGGKTKDVSIVLRDLI